MNTAEAGTDTKVQLVRSAVARQRRTEKTCVGVKVLQNRLGPMGRRRARCEV